MKVRIIALQRAGPSRGSDDYVNNIMTGPSPERDTKIVSSISTLMLNTLTLK